MSGGWREKRVDHAVLEDQMCSFTGVPGEQSPDVLDAMVYGITELMVNVGSTGGVYIATEKDLIGDNEEESMNLLEGEARW